jgi:hypothetical protein
VKKNMADTFIGYEFLRRNLRLSAFEIARPAAIKPVTRVESLGTVLAVPKVVAPSSNAPLDHLLRAEARGHRVADGGTGGAPYRATRASRRTAGVANAVHRRACLLWEELQGKTLRMCAITRPM